MNVTSMIETRRHDEFGVDLTGYPQNLKEAMLALDVHHNLVVAVRAIVNRRAWIAEQMSAGKRDGVLRIVDEMEKELQKLL